MQIVVCDGDPLLREVIEAVVTRTGHEVAGSADVIEAVNGAQPGDGLLSLEVDAESEAVASDATRLKADGDIQELQLPS